MPHAQYHKHVNRNTKMTQMPPEHDSMNHTPTRDHKLLKSKSDWVMLGVIIAVVLGVLLVWLSGIRSDRPDPDTGTGTSLSREEKTQVEDTVKRYISTAGTFGFDWSAADDESKDTSIQTVHDKWIMYTDTGQPFPADMSQYIKPRDVALQSLSMPADGHAGVRSKSTASAYISSSALSDAFYVSQFTSPADDVNVSWKGTTTGRQSDGTLKTTVKASWDTTWTRITVVPQNNGTSREVPTKEQWKPATDKYQFRDVRITLVQLPNNDWQVASINDGGNNDLNKYGWMLADGINVKYTQDGTMLGEETVTQNEKE